MKLVQQVNNNNNNNKHYIEISNYTFILCRSEQDVIDVLTKLQRKGFAWNNKADLLDKGELSLMYKYISLNRDGNKSECFIEGNDKTFVVISIESSSHEDAELACFYMRLSDYNKHIKEYTDNLYTWDYKYDFR